MKNPLIPHKLTKLDIINQRFGKLLVKGFHSKGNGENLSPTFECLCDCGNTTYISRKSLISKNTSSCGCGLKERYTRLADDKIRQQEYGSAQIGSILSTYRCSARNRNLEFTLTKDDIKNIIFKNCHYCNMEAKNFQKGLTNRINGNRFYNGIDRKDNLKGYTLDNCLPCCFTCNRAKHTSTYEDFKQWISNLIKNNSN
jgi:hypothetical protein